MGEYEYTADSIQAILESLLLPNDEALSMESAVLNLTALADAALVWHNTGEALLDEITETASACGLDQRGLDLLLDFLTDELEVIVQDAPEEQQAGSQSGACKSAYEQYMDDMNQYPKMSQKEVLKALEVYKQGKEAKSRLDAEGENLSPETKADLEKLFQKGQQAKDEIINRHFRLPVWCAGRFNQTGIEKIDWIQVGNLAMITALEEYDPTKAAFSTFVVLRIKKAMQTYANKSKDIYSKSTRYFEDLNRLLKVKKAIGAKTAQAATEKELAQITGMTVKRVRTLLEQLDSRDTVDSLERWSGEGFNEKGKRRPGDRLEDPKAQEALEAIIAKPQEEIRHDLAVVLRKYLSPIEEVVIRARKGLEGGQCYSASELEKELQYDKSYIAEIEKTAYEKLQSLHTIILHDEFLT